MNKGILMLSAFFLLFTGSLVAQSSCQSKVPCKPVCTPEARAACASVAQTEASVGAQTTTVNHPEVVSVLPVKMVSLRSANAAKDAKKDLCDPQDCDPSKCDPSKCDPSKCDPGKCPPQRSTRTTRI